MAEARAESQWTELIKFADATGELRVSLNSDRTRAVLAVTRGAGTQRPRVETLQRLLREKGITKHLDSQRIATALLALRQPFAAVSDVLVAQGTPPVHGRDGCLQPACTAQNLKVSPGDCVAIVKMPEPGRDGEDVFGRPIAARPGNPLRPRLGSHVQLDDSGCSVLALLAGFALVVGDYANVSQRFALHVSADALTARIGFDDPEVGGEDIKQILTEAGIGFGVRDAAIESAVRKGRADNDLVAAGIRPLAGRDARLEYFFARKPGTRGNPPGEDRAGNPNPLAMFQPGDVLLRLRVAEDGVPGFDVFGRPIAVRDVLKIEIEAGENVLQERSGDTIRYTSAIHGAPFLEQSVLRVSDELLVQGNLTPAMGNIEFEGSVHIQGDVPNGYRVSCQGRLQIDGVVNEAALCSGGDTVIDSGCMGAGKALIKTGGTLTAKYIDHARVESEGDVCVANEVIASRIDCLGRADLRRAVVRGGEICALGGIEVRILGSDDHVATRVMAGEDFRVLRFAANCAAKDQTLLGEIRKINDRLSAYRDGARALGGLNTADKEEIHKGLERIEEITAQREELAAALQRKRSAEHPGQCAEIIVNGHLYPGAHVTIGEAQHPIRQSVRGPVKIINSGEIEIVSPGRSR